MQKNNRVLNRLVSSCHGIRSALKTPYWLGAGLVAAVLAGCSALPQPPAATSLYDFGVLATQDVAGTPASAQANANVKRVAVMLTPVQATGLPTKSQAVLYRYTYAEDQQLRAYQQAQWSQPIEQLIGAQVRQGLEHNRIVFAPYGPQPKAAQGTTLSLVALQLDVEHFEQRFNAPGSSEGVLRLRATATQPDARGGSLLGQQVFERRVPATTADAEGGTRAMAQAAQAVAADIDAWLAKLPQ